MLNSINSLVQIIIPLDFVPKKIIIVIPLDFF
jgi:hypothetical protein